jgi:NAD(P)-dependent dehydrogenase (short-subunit alcohol dehydrogenase family)
MCGAPKSLAMSKVAVITGGARGIGLATARALKADGWRVALLDIDPTALDKAVAELGTASATPFVLDISRVEDIQALFPEIALAMGGLDCLVNNAGVFRNEPLLAVEERTYDWLMDINLKGAFFCLQAAAREMQRGDGGVIVNIASAAGRGGRPTQTVYGMTKAGLIHLTKSAAIALAPNIRVCCVCPAAVDTEMMATNFAQRRQVGGDADAEAFMAKLLVGRLSRPEEVADLVAYLASDKAGYITGGSIDISGGLEMH